MSPFCFQLILWALYSLIIPQISSVPVPEDLHTQDFNPGTTPTPRSLAVPHLLESRASTSPPHGCFREGKQINPKGKGKYAYAIFNNYNQKYAKVFIKRKLGEGGQGEIWDAELEYLSLPQDRPWGVQPNDPQPVVVKTAPGGSLLDTSDLQQLIDSRFVMRFKERFWSPRVMESVLVMPKGRIDLMDALNDNMRINVPRIIQGAGLGLLAAHAKRIVHRDIKPENILLWRHGVWVIDWDWAKMMDDGITTSTELTGSPDYQSPEARDGEYDVYKNDVWGLAKTYLTADQWHKLGNQHYHDWLTEELQRPKTYKDTDSFLEGQFSERVLSKAKRRVMAKGLCQQGSRFPLQRWIEEFEKAENLGPPEEETN
ncbi:Pkinase-domain-containing protein [Penicillium alfredii]|uniref:Pkinase-domain-containing protein n=1 Tax=Penicillium alfredii TaxID=1506179 RepID=A0A9W9KR41_9EURO|nr:Pkinase-domain-containing protein [Penicillium alfredii]KAJ5115125.1 Pkinase-domain-containing protein [Penicillium alfredii]